MTSRACFGNHGGELVRPLDEKWRCVSMIPGITNRPSASITLAPRRPNAGRFRRSCRRARMSAFSFVPLVTVSTVAFRMVRCRRCTTSACGRLQFGGGLGCRFFVRFLVIRLGFLLVVGLFPSGCLLLSFRQGSYRPVFLVGGATIFLVARLFLTSYSNVRRRRKRSGRSSLPGSRRP